MYHLINISTVNFNKYFKNKNSGNIYELIKIINIEKK